MGLFDDVIAEGPEFICSEGHPIHGIQTKDLGATMGCAEIKDGRFSFDDGGWGGGGDSDFDPPSGPLTRTIEIYGHCEKCPAFVQGGTLNLVPFGAEFRVEIVNDAIVSVVRTSEDLAAFLKREPEESYMTRFGCYGPMPYERAYRIHCRQEQPPSGEVTR